MRVICSRSGGPPDTHARVGGAVGGRGSEGSGSGVEQAPLVLNPKPSVTLLVLINPHFCALAFAGGLFCFFLSRKSSYMEHATALREGLSKNDDMELRFQGGHSIPVHSQKLKLASSVLNDMLTASLDDQIASAAAKRRKTAEGGSAAGQDMPYVQVSWHSRAYQ